MRTGKHQASRAFVETCPTIALCGPCSCPSQWTLPEILHTSAPSETRASLLSVWPLFVLNYPSLFLVAPSFECTPGVIAGVTQKDLPPPKPHVPLPAAVLAFDLLQDTILALRCSRQIPTKVQPVHFRSPAAVAAMQRRRQSSLRTKTHKGGLIQKEAYPVYTSAKSWAD